VPNLALIALGDSHHSQGGMKFATQISPLLNYLIKDMNNTAVNSHSAWSLSTFLGLFCLFSGNPEKAGAQ
jgi:hypothetical protein